MSPRRQPEAQLQRAVLDHLRWRGVANLFVCHIPNGGWRSRTEASILRGLGVVAGAPDLLIVSGGRIYGLELKSDRGRLSPAQIETHENLRAAGAQVTVCHGIDEVLAALDRWNLLRRSRRDDAGFPREGKRT